MTQKQNRAMQEAELVRLREEIDRVDDRLLEILTDRAKLSVDVGLLKRDDVGAPVYRPDREIQILQRIAGNNTGPMRADHVQSIWREILSVSRAMQRVPSVAYLGPDGTFSSLAAMALLGNAMNYVPMGNIAEVFRVVNNGECDLGLVPLENSIHGGVGQTLDLFLAHPGVFIQSECFFRVTQCLLSREEDTGAVATVYSHPQALAQCDVWLRANLPEARTVPVPGTAQAAKIAAAEPGTAAVGHLSLGERYGLNVLARGIEDLPDNRTRFVVIGRDLMPVSDPGSDTLTSVILTLPDKPGALTSVLSPMAEAGVNMKKLESRPLKSEPWKYAFFVDMECNLNAPEHAALTEVLRSRCQTFRVLGTYPAGKLIPQAEEKEA